ncbi:MAG: DUF2550 domain-containing protein [Bifidobacteriaceae bacterium]|jgi:hypothetical protein|nr:DUF2550 domain-containing protein [Bifidobacteriaceae bacterium]
MLHLLAVAAACLAVAAFGLLGLVWLRWQYLKARPGLFPCFVVEGEAGRRRERAGLATYTPMALEWFARNSLNPGPALRWPRRGLLIKARDAATGSKTGWQAVQLKSGGATHLLIISRGASSGLLSWIEAGPTNADAS